MNIKLCPFCGGSASLDENEFEGGKVYCVYCENCGASTGASEDKQCVIDDWNKREEIAPCPFCGGKALVCEVDADGEKLLTVACVDCGISTMASDDEAEAVAFWNRRA